MDQNSKGLTITLQYLDTEDASAEAQERIFIQQDGVVAVYVIPFCKRGDLDRLILEISRLVQRDTLLDI